jgi:hypothetical protein
MVSNWQRRATFHAYFTRRAQALQSCKVNCCDPEARGPEVNFYLAGYEVDWQLPDDPDRTANQNPRKTLKSAAATRTVPPSETNGVVVAAPCGLRPLFEVAHGKDATH